MNPFLQKIIELQDVPVNNSNGIHNLIHRNIKNNDIRNHLEQLTGFSEYIYFQPQFTERDINVLQILESKSDSALNIDNEIETNGKMIPTVKMIREHIKKSILNGIERRNQINEYLMAYINNELDRLETYSTAPSLARIAYNNLPDGILDRVDRFKLRKVRGAVVDLPDVVIRPSPLPSPNSSIGLRRIRSRSSSRSSSKGSKRSRSSKGGTRKQNN
jgi:hypothetical protein